LGILGTSPDGYAAVAALSTFTTTPNEQHRCDLAMLHNARCVIAHETEENRSWPIAKLKLMTSGDPITARFQRKDFFTYVPRFKVTVLGNHKPQLRGTDEAIRRRLHLIPFAVTIPEAERDDKLSEKLAAEYPGILRWMLEGCVAWQREGLAPPARVTGATAEYLAAEDLIQTWMDECCRTERDKAGYLSIL
jgi:putative DNA primase/helicase